MAFKQRRYQPPGDVRSFGDQLEELIEVKGLQKQDVATMAEITPAQLSHYLKFGTSLRMIERISKALKVEPEYFDTYVAENSPVLVQHHRELLELHRLLCTSSDSKKRALLKKLASLVE